MNGNTISFIFIKTESEHIDGYENSHVHTSVFKTGFSILLDVFVIKYDNYNYDEHVNYFN